MNVGKLRNSSGETVVGVLSGDVVHCAKPGYQLAELLANANPIAVASEIIKNSHSTVPAESASWLAPVDRQEIWAAGVTYTRSRQARMDESESAASFYDRVYAADRPELFFKATPARVSGPNQPVRVRADSRWSVPEPEFALALSPNLRIVGYTIGNDMSARDIEGENPLYLPQAKVYSQCVALGPSIKLIEAVPAPESIAIAMDIMRAGKICFHGTTSLAAMKRTPAELVGWLARENEFADGAFLLTGTGIVPPDDFTLQDGDEVAIEITGVGKIFNPVVKG